MRSRGALAASCRAMLRCAVPCAACCRAGDDGLQTLTLTLTLPPPPFPLPPPGVPRAQQPGALPQRLPQRPVVGIRYGTTVAPNASALPELLQSTAVRQPGALHMSELLLGGGWRRGGRLGGTRAQSHGTASRSRSQLRGFFQDPTQESASQQRRK